MFAESMAGRNISVAVAADDGYAMPLAVTVRSLLDHLTPGRRLTLYLLDGGISDESHRRLLASWDSDRIDLHIVRPDAKRLFDLNVSHHVNHLTYYRILLPELLPASLGKVIYLDSDLLIRRDIGELWDQPLNDSWALAAQDCAAPFFDASIACPNFRDCGPYLAAVRPVENYRALGLKPKSPYLNGGVLVIDLDAWRRQRLTDKMLTCLRDNAKSVLWWDQYALNVALNGQWRSLDRRWNQGAHIFKYGDWHRSPFPKPEYEELTQDPWIVHFTSPIKPWQPLCKHPFQGEYESIVASTAFTINHSVMPYLQSLLRRSWYAAIRIRHVYLERRRLKSHKH